MVQVTPKTFLWISLLAHVAVGAAVYRRTSHTSEATPALLNEPEAVLSGDTFDVPEELPAPAAEPVPLPRFETKALNSVATPEGTRHRSATGQARAGGGESGSGTVFGASGDRASVDIATAFTRGFPQAASADPVWAAAPFGPAGEAVVVLEIDESGALVSARIEGSPGPGLRAGIARTIALLRARSFTASRPVTRLQVSANVSPNEVHDGLHGEVFALGGSFEKSVGDAFFALAIGRRVDLRVREARMEHPPSE
jgi:hypothetical protein